MAEQRARSRRQYVDPPMPGFVEPQELNLVAEPPVGEAWLHEIKFDGYRVQLHAKGGDARIYTRRGADWTARFPKLAAELARLPPTILDGELCAVGTEGKPSFSALQRSLTAERSEDLVVFAFDCLWRGREDMRPYSTVTRKAVLAEVLSAASSPSLREVTAVPAGGRALLESACRLELEGIVSKRLDAPYRAGKTGCWLKSKCRPGLEVVIGGWVEEPGGGFKSLLAGVHEGRGLRYVGSVQTGFGAASKGLLGKLREREQETSPFVVGSPRKNRQVHWARPDLVAAVEIAEWTEAGRLRQSSFKGLREDREALEVWREFPA